MIDSYIIGAYWGSRSEPLNQVRDKILRTIEKLSKIDQLFIKWYELGMSRKEALSKQIIFNNETIQKLCLEQVRKGELDENGFSEMGFLVGLWTGHKEYEASSISFNVGTNNRWLTNSCVINIPYQGTAKTRLLQFEKSKEIIELMIEIWNPDYAVLTSDILRDKLDVGNRIGWITYCKSITQSPEKIAGINYEHTSGGHWFSPILGIDYEDASIENLSKVKEVLNIS